MTNHITDQQWAQYEQDGYLKLGAVIPQDQLKALQERIDAIMLGNASLNYDNIMMQLDSADGQYNNAGEQSRGFKGASLGYRKIQDLEFDDLFLAYMQEPIFAEICAHVYGPGIAVSSFRAMFMNKPAHAGTLLPWHQDRWSFLNIDPLITLWTALDPATQANGCVEIIPGSHKWGVINPSHGSGFLTEEQAADVAAGGSEFVELAPGEVVLLHNWLLHRSGVNETDIARRAFSVCYMEAKTRTTGGAGFPLIFTEEGENAPAPHVQEAIS